MWLNEFCTRIVDRRDQREYEGPAYNPKFPIDGYRTYKIPPEEEYRADKIAFKFYGDESLSWVLDKANNFVHGFKEYKEGRIILRPTLEAMREMRLL